MTGVIDSPAPGLGLPVSLIGVFQTSLKLPDRPTDTEQMQPEAEYLTNLNKHIMAKCGSGNWNIRMNSLVVFKFFILSGLRKMLWEYA